MRIIGVRAAGGSPVFSAILPHGEDPHRLAWEHGYRVLRPLSASGTSPDLQLTVQVSAHHRDRTVREPHRRTMDADLDADVLAGPPVPRQRVAAYGIVLSPFGLLATQFSEMTAVPGLWGLPGGGIDAGESPSQAVVREVSEETGQQLSISQLLDVHTDHWIGRAPSGVVEDFHAVRIVYAGHCPTPSSAIVHDIGGTTAAAEWIGLDEWTHRPWSSWARLMLDRHLPSLLAAH